MESKEYLEWCKNNNLDSSLVKNYNEYQNEMEYQDYLNSIKEDLEVISNVDIANKKEMVRYDSIWRKKRRI